jgi:deazaflavin-dependent oxidoreductase (nitroreductase family)
MKRSLNARATRTRPDSKQQSDRIELLRRLERAAGIPFVQLTHYGFKTGRPYRTTLWFVADGDSIYVIAGSHSRGWARNLMARRHVNVELGAERFAGQATPVRIESEQRRVRRSFERKYWYARPLFCVNRALVTLGLIQQWGTEDTMFRIVLRGRRSEPNRARVRTASRSSL